jgi:hypothetical protein
VALAEGPRRSIAPKTSYLQTTPTHWSGFPFLCALFVRNDGDQDVLFFIVGAPPEEGGADYLPDVD